MEGKNETIFQTPERNQVLNRTGQQETLFSPERKESFKGSKCGFFTSPKEREFSSVKKGYVINDTDRKLDESELMRQKDAVPIALLGLAVMGIMTFVAWKNISERIPLNFDVGISIPVLAVLIFIFAWLALFHKVVGKAAEKRNRRILFPEKEEKKNGFF